MRTPLLLLALSGLTLALGAATSPAQDDEGPTYIDDGRPAQLERWEELSCVECHEDIAREWAETTHALAWVDPHYQEALKDKRRPQGCHGCHIPAPLHQGDLSRKPRAREETEGDPDAAHHFGITCNTCHLGPEGEILGPWGAETDAHVSVASPSFQEAGRDALCASCHRTTIGPVIGIARDFVSGQGRSCVGCHMPVELRPAAIRPDGTASEERLGRSHRLNGPRDPEFVARAFELSVAETDGGVALRIENAAGHQVPGLTTRRFLFEVTLLDAAGESVASGELTLDSRAHLPVDGTREVALDGTGAEVHVVGRHEAPGLDEPVVFVDERLAVPNAD